MFIYLFFFIEIPLYHISNAQITFGNLFGKDTSVEGVQTLDSDGKIFCVVEDSVFVPPRNYIVLGKILFIKFYFMHICILQIN